MQLYCVWQQKIIANVKCHGVTKSSMWKLKLKSWINSEVINRFAAMKSLSYRHDDKKLKAEQIWYLMTWFQAGYTLILACYDKFNKMKKHNIFHTYHFFYKYRN